jgi:tRNA(fMet)-specific endonuclease VapC
MRGNAASLQPYRIGWTIILPLHVAGELYFGAFASALVEQNLATVDDLAKTWSVLPPTEETARIYGRLRAREAAWLTPSKLNDLWIAALCLQHDLPLVTNDGGFDAISGLTVIHW